MKHLYTFFFPFFLLACAGPQVNSGLPIITESDYQSVIEKNTQRSQKYSGLANTLDVQATILNSTVSAGQSDQYARIYQWNAQQWNEDKIKSEQKLAQKSEFFVSFYTPERKHNDLHKNKTLWKIFLDTGSQRYEGKATKVKLLTEEVRRFYPYYTKFTTPYLIEFPVSMKSIEGKDLKLTITGTVGSAQLLFAPVTGLK
ncbi:MAG: hypothetical protein ACOYOK_00325 [Pseudobdellovibrionaceae bacterium]